MEVVMPGRFILQINFISGTPNTYHPHIYSQIIYLLTILYTFTVYLITEDEI